MIALSPREVAEATGGVLQGVPDATQSRVSLTGVVVDSRAARPGTIFVAIPGERVDGHGFAGSAVAAGCALVLCSRPLVDEADAPLPCVVVDDPVVALGALASWYRRERLTCSVVAVTGSSGKTSTKDLIARVLAVAGATVSAQGSFNTEVGLPLTVLEADEHTRYLVLEMGMRGEGHIAYLVALVPPDIAVVLNVGSAHLGMLGSREAIARAKSELVRDLPASAVAVLNADDHRVAAMAEQTQARVLTFGEALDADVRATEVRLDDRARACFTLTDARSGNSAEVCLALSGRHHVSNALAAAAVGLLSGLTAHQVAAALGDARPDSRWRMEVHQAAAGVIVVNDAYNANPESMRAALESLAAMAQGRRTWAVLGEMRELGDIAQEEHEAIGRAVAELGISRLLCVGAEASGMCRGASDVPGWAGEATQAADIDEAIGILCRQVEPTDIVLVKASRTIGLERVADALLADDALVGVGSIQDEEART